MEIYLIAVPILLLIAYMRFEASFIKIDNANINSPSYFKIMQLSDLHIGRMKVSFKKISAILLLHKPDAVVITGDFLENASDLPRLIKFISIIKNHTPIYACLGNHDHNAFNDVKEINKFCDTLSSLGVTVLINDSALFKKGDITLNITGIDDIRTGNASIPAAINSVYKDAHAKIVLSHNPDTAILLPKNIFDVLLSGHFHGGQIWTPFGLEFHSLRKDILCRIGMKKGLHNYKGLNVYISRGLGNVLVPFRFLSRPEITIINI